MARILGRIEGRDLTEHPAFSRIPGRQRTLKTDARRAINAAMRAIFANSDVITRTSTHGFTNLSKQSGLYTKSDKGNHSITRLSRSARKPLERIGALIVHRTRDPENGQWLPIVIEWTALGMEIIGTSLEEWTKAARSRANFEGQPLKFGEDEERFDLQQRKTNFITAWLEKVRGRRREKALKKRERTLARATLRKPQEKQLSGLIDALEKFWSRERRAKFTDSEMLNYARRLLQQAKEENTEEWPHAEDEPIPPKIHLVEPEFIPF